MYSTENISSLLKFISSKQTYSKFLSLSPRRYKLSPPLRGTCYEVAQYYSSAKTHNFATIQDIIVCFFLNGSLVSKY